MSNEKIPSHLRKFEDHWNTKSGDPEIRVKMGKLFRAMQWYPDTTTIDTWIEYLGDIPKENVLNAVDEVIRNNQKKNTSIAEIRHLSGKSKGKSTDQTVDDKLMEMGITDTLRRKVYADKAAKIIKDRPIPRGRVEKYIGEYFDKVYGYKFHSGAKDQNIELKQFKYMALADWMAASFKEKDAIQLALDRPDSDKIRRDLIRKYSK